MSREQLRAEALAAGKAAKHNLQWIRRHPDRIDPSKRVDMEIYLNGLIRFAKEEIKNARRAGRTSLRVRLKHLTASILSHHVGAGKGERA